MMNRYFRTVSPVRIFRHVGLSESNTWIGSSRSINTVMHAENTLPGDEIHALVGGTFLVRDGEAFPVSLAPRKPILEKSYGGGHSPVNTMEGYAKAGRAAEIEAPSVSPEYGAAAKKVREIMLEPLLPELVEIEKSPEYVHLIGALGPVVTDIKADGVGVKWTAGDINAYGGVKSAIESGSDQFTFYVFDDFSVRMMVPAQRYRGDGKFVESTDEKKAWLKIPGPDCAEAIRAVMADAFREAPVPQA